LQSLNLPNSEIGQSKFILLIFFFESTHFWGSFSGLYLAQLTIEHFFKNSQLGWKSSSWLLCEDQFLWVFSDVADGPHCWDEKELKCENDNRTQFWNRHNLFFVRFTIVETVTIVILVIPYRRHVNSTSFSLVLTSFYDVTLQTVIQDIYHSIK